MTTSPNPARLKSGLPLGLEGFSFRASIDWIEIELTLIEPSQWHAVRRRAYGVWGNLFVESLESDESSKKFRFRVQNPRSPDEFLRQLQTLARAGESLTEESVKITGVEIAIDARHPSNAPEILATAALYLLRHQANLPNGRPRITIPAYFDAPILAAKYAAAMDANSIAIADANREGRQAPGRLLKKDGECPDVESNREALRALRRCLTINQGRAPRRESGDRGDSYRSRHYVKTKDTRDGIAYAPLPTEEYSARSERTWIDRDVPFVTIEEWRHFRFETLAADFALVLPVETDNPLVALLQEASIQLGRGTDSYKIRPSDRRKRAAFTRRDSVTNDRIRQALRALTRAQSCENSVTNLPAIDMAPEGDFNLHGASPEYSNHNTVNQSAMIDHSSVTVSNQDQEETDPGPCILPTYPTTARSGKHEADDWRAVVKPSLIAKVMKRVNEMARHFMDSMSTAWRMAPG
ncbi:hypothetical protein [Rhodoferax ferrireducens]|uniref:hypothetical protein n=1 Tax=Rhodoferax ferrireducens TaxID=192843 RepID=UPI003BB6151C